MQRAALVMCALLISLPVHAQVGAITVRLHAQAHLAKAQYTLGDVAQISGGAESPDSIHSTDVAALAAITLGVAPRMGQAQAVQRTEIARVIERHRPDLRGRIRWDGAQAVTLRSQGLRYDGRELLAAARGFLQERLAPDFERVELTPVGKIEDLYYPQGELSVTARLGQAALHKRMCVWLNLSVDGRPYRSVPVWFAVQAYRPAWVAKSALAGQQAVSAQDVVQETREVAAFADAIPAAQGWTGMRLKRPLAAGEVLRQRDLEPVPAVIRAQDVRVRVAAGAVAVETQGKALADGHIGDRIKIASPRNEAYFGRVVGEGLVLIEGK